MSQAILTTYLNQVTAALAQEVETKIKAEENHGSLIQAKVTTNQTKEGTRKARNQSQKGGRREATQATITTTIQTQARMSQERGQNIAETHQRTTTVNPMTANMTEESKTAPEQERTKSRKITTHIETSTNQAMTREAGRTVTHVEMNTSQAMMKEE